MPCPALGPSAPEVSRPYQHASDPRLGRSSQPPTARRVGQGTTGPQGYQWPAHQCPAGAAMAYATLRQDEPCMFVRFEVLTDAAATVFGRSTLGRVKKKDPGDHELLPESWTEKFSSDFRGAVLAMHVVRCQRISTSRCSVVREGHCRYGDSRLAGRLSRAGKASLSAVEDPWSRSAGGQANKACVLVRIQARIGRTVHRG